MTTPACGNKRTESGGEWLCSRPLDHEGPHHGVGGVDHVLMAWSNPEGE